MAVLQPDEVRRIILTAITAVASDDLLAERLVLKGGNALHLVYEIGSRASADLDFSMAADMSRSELSGRLERALRERFDAMGYEVFDFKCEARPSDSETGIWGGYVASFKLVPRDRIVEIEREELRRIGRKAERKPTTAVPLQLSEEERRSCWRRNFGYVYCIDVSKYEYVETHEAREIEGYTCAVYSPSMIAAEKLRALCQQMKEYPQRRNPSSRARDFYDLHALVTSRLQVDLSTETELVRSMFAAKQVPLVLLGELAKYREFHRTTWAVVEQSVGESELAPFDFYFDFVLGLVAQLQALWKS